MISFDYYYKYHDIYNNMTLEQKISLTFKYMKSEMSSRENKKPGASFIYHNILQSTFLKPLFSDSTGEEVVKVSFIVFYLFSGFDLESSKFKSENLYFTSITSIDGVENEIERCEECEGTGQLACVPCDQSGSVDCVECEGLGELGDEDGNFEECNYCGGHGSLTCDECYGDSAVTCNECGGDGEIETGEVMASLTSASWVFADESLFMKLQEMYDDYQYMDDYELTNMLDENEDIKGSFILISTRNYNNDVNIIEITNAFDSGISKGDSYVSELGKLDDYANSLKRYNEVVVYDNYNTMY